MKLTRRRLRKIIFESIEDESIEGGRQISNAEKLAGLLEEAGEDYGAIRQYFELAVAVDLAEPDTLNIMDLSDMASRRGTIVSFIATKEFEIELMMTFSSVSSEPVLGTDLYEVTYSL